MTKYYHAKYKVNKLKHKVAAFASAGVLALGAGGFGLLMPLTAGATADPVVVTPANTQGWAESDTRVGGTVNYVADSTAPLGSGALQLSTDNTTAAKADYMHAANVPLSSVTELSYATRQLAASSAGGDASLQLAVDTNGSAAGGFTTLVYEPYWQNNANPDPAPVVANTWQTWNNIVSDGLFWSSKSAGGLTAGAGGAPFYTLAQVEAMNPDAQLLGYGVNVGTYNPGYMINVDAFNFNGTTYDFEQVPPDTQAPSVAITNPVNGSTVQGTVDVRGTVTDEHPDHYYLNISNDSTGQVVYSHTTYDSQSFTDQSLYSWDTTTVVDGNYTILLAARDQAGNRSGNVYSHVTVNNTPDNKDQCKDGGWMSFAKPSFKNQGQCVSFTNHNDGNGADDAHANNR